MLALCAAQQSRGHNTDLVHDPGHPDLALVALGGAEWGRRAGPRRAVPDPVDVESVQVVVLPTHRHLDDVVQLCEGEPARTCSRRQIGGSMYSSVTLS